MRQPSLSAADKEKLRLYTIMLVLANVINISARIYNNKVFDKLEIAEFVFFSLVNWTTFSEIVNRMKYRVSYENFLDVFWMNTFVQFSTSFKKAFWLCYALVPLYMAYAQIREWVAPAGKAKSQPNQEDADKVTDTKDKDTPQAKEKTQ